MDITVTSSEAPGANGHPSQSPLSAWHARSVELAEWTERLLVNRNDVWGGYNDIEDRKKIVEFANGHIGALGKNITRPPVSQRGKAFLTRMILEQHFRATKARHVIGLHTTCASNTSRWGAIEIDRHDQNTCPEKNRRAAIALFDRFRLLGFYPILLDADGKGGYHLLIVSTEPVPTADVFHLLQGLTRNFAALELTTRPETFPKQERIPTDGCGNWLRLIGRHHTSDHWARVWDGTKFLDGEDAVNLILGVTGDSPDLFRAVLGNYQDKSADDLYQLDSVDDDFKPQESPREVMIEAIRYVPNGSMIPYDASSKYPSWLGMGMVIHSVDPTTAGLKVWEAWSAQCKEKHDRTCTCAQKWNSFGRFNGRKISLGSLVLWARANGWTGPKRQWRPADGQVPEPGDTLEAGDEAGQADAGQAGSGKEDNGDVVDPGFLTDVGNGRRYVADHGAIVRYCHPWKKWLIWDGKRWRIDNTGRAISLAKRTVLRLFWWAKNQIKLLAQNECPEARIQVAKIKAILDFAVKSQHINRLKAMVDLAKSEPGIPILPEELDTHIWLYNCPNGTLDLRTGKLRPHDHRDYLTKICPTRYVPSAPCPIFVSTVKSIFAANKSLIECVQRYLGYCLTGETREQALPIANGKGANGKTLFLRTVLNVMGADYAGIVPAELLVETKGDQHPTIKATLFGKRLMIAFETAENARLNEARIKSLTGEDGISSRRMKEDFWEFIATHKIILCTNHLPRIRGQDKAIWRRLAIWPFLQTYWDSDKGETGAPEFKADKTLKVKLQAEHEGILAWLVQGGLDWQQHGIILPDVVRSATNDYKTIEDILGTFIAERCVIREQVKVTVSSLWKTFKVWAEHNNHTPGTSTAFGNAMADREFKKDGGKRNYLGIGLLAPDPTENEQGGPHL